MLVVGSHNIIGVMGLLQSLPVDTMSDCWFSCPRHSAARARLTDLIHEVYGHLNDYGYSSYAQNNCILVVPSRSYPIYASKSST